MGNLNIIFYFFNRVETLSFLSLYNPIAMPNNKPIKVPIAIFFGNEGLTGVDFILGKFIICQGGAL